MIAGVRGRLEAKGRDNVVVDCGGVLYQVFVPGSTLSEIGMEGETVMLHTFLYVREDQLSLYGCKTRRELDLFNTLLGVTGVGPRLALAILGTMPPDTLESAIAQGDLNLLTRTPGVGKKLAQRMVLELKGKLDLSTIAGPSGVGALPQSGPLAEVADALSSLHYSSAEIQAILPKLSQDPNASVEELMMTALQQMGS